MPEKTRETGDHARSGKMRDANGGNFRTDANAAELFGSNQEQKPQASDIKCAEIKAIPSVVNCHGELKKNVFKIGEYNRATASFEMGPESSTSPDKQQRRMEFDLSLDTGSDHYFKSSFARSIAVSSSSKSRSLDYTLANGQASPPEDLPRDIRKQNGSSSPAAEIQTERDFWQMLGSENWDLRKAQPAEIRDDLSSTGSIVSDLHPQSKKTDLIEEHLKQSLLLERPGSRASSIYQRSVSSYGDRRLEDVLFRSPLTASCRSSYHRPYSSASDVDTVLLQSQVTTLQWQLRQAEASRQMQRAVLEQVVSFLQRTHKNLDQIQNRILEDIGTVNRVPRSRSVHGVDTSPSRLSSPRSESNLSFQKAKSVAQIPDPFCPKHGSAYRDMTWRRPRKQQYDADEVTPSKLSEEAFRLLRTVQSLLNTREPDLSSRLSTATCSSPGNPAEASSASSTVSATLDSDNSDNFQSQETLRNRTPIPDRFSDSVVSSACRVPVSRSRMNSRNSYNEEKNSPPQLSICSADDESGFSSLNSFQEVGVPVCGSSFSGSKNMNSHPEQKKAVYHAEEGDVGLPRVDEVTCRIHRRWSSTPADNQSGKARPPSLTNGEILRVLWV